MRRSAHATRPTYVVFGTALVAALTAGPAIHETAISEIAGMKRPRKMPRAGSVSTQCVMSGRLVIPDGMSPWWSATA